MPLWAGIPTAEQAERIVKENLLDERAFWAPHGVRTLSTYEKMYRIVGTSNPSSWHGGVWILSNREELEVAIKELDAEIIETTGHIKPEWINEIN